MNISFVKRFSLLLLAVVLAGIAFWLLLPTFISTEFVRSGIERRITEASGRRVEIGATSKIRLFPSPFAQLDNVSIYPLSRTGRGQAEVEPIAVIKAIELQLTPASLISDRPSFSSLRMIEPAFTLNIGENSDFASQIPVSNVAQAIRVLRAHRAEQRAEITEGGDQAGSTGPIPYPDWLQRDVGSISIIDGTVTLVDDDTLPDPVEITDVNGRIDWPRLDASLVLAGTGRYKDQDFSINYQTGLPVDALAGELAPARLEAKSSAGRFGFNGEAGFAAGFYAVGDITFETQSLRRLLRLYGQAPLPVLGLEDIAIDAKLKARGSSLRLDQMNMNIEGNTGTGLMEITTRSDGEPAVIGTLDFQSLDLEKFFGAFVAFPETIASRKPFSTRFMDQIQTDLRLSADKANFRSLTLMQVAATAQTTRDIALFDVGDASAFGGTMQGRLRFERSTKEGSAALSISAQDINLAAARTALGLPAIFPEGTGTVQLQMTSPLTDWQSLLGHGSGAFQLRAAPGHFAGFDPQILSDLAADTGFSPLGAGAGSPSGFDTLTLEATIEDGKLQVGDAVAQYPNATITLNGIVQTVSGSLALTAELDEQPPGDTQENPVRKFIISGGLSSPYAFPILSEPSGPFEQ